MTDAHVVVAGQGRVLIPADARDNPDFPDKWLELMKDKEQE